MALGIELECSNLVIRPVPGKPPGYRDCKKGRIIKSGHGYDMTEEETAAGVWVVEFVTRPHFNLSELEVALAGCFADAANPSVHSVKKHTLEWEDGSSKEAAVQATMGVPLSKLWNLYALTELVFPETATGIVKERYKKCFLAGDKKTPCGRDAAGLSDSLKGFALIIMDYLRRGYLPSGTAGEIPFAKALYPVMARTAMSAVFWTLSDADIQLISTNTSSGQLALNAEWCRWFVELALVEEDVAAHDRAPIVNKLLEQPIIQQTLNNRPLDAGRVVSRRQFLRHLPAVDELKTAKLLGVGAMGSRVDRLRIDDKEILAPILELRKPFEGNKSIEQWPGLGEELWAAYAKTLGDGAVFNEGTEVVMNRNLLV